jgi:hypothetical protein
MKLVAIIMSVLLSSCSFGVAQGNPSGPGAVTGDPAASTAKPSADPAKTRGQQNSSGSGTSTSGGKDDNGDQGRGKMPESNMTVKPRTGKPNIPNAANR